MSETGEREPKKRRLRIATAAGPIVVLVPADASVADACAAVEARLRGSGQLGKRRIRTLLLPELGELGAADSLTDAVEDGEELRPVFEDADAEGGPDKRAGGQGAGPGEELRPVLEQAGAEGGPDERAGGEGAGQGEAKLRRVEHGQGAAAVSGSPEGGARDEGKEGNSAENVEREVELRLRVREGGVDADKIVRVRANLQILDLSHWSKMTALPAELGALTGLRELNLSFCSGLTALPAGLGALMGLQELYLRECFGLTALPAGLGALTDLCELDLFGCSGLTALPAELGALTDLQSLVLSGCCGLTALPEELGAITGLRELYLRGCSRLTALPVGLGALTGLRELDLLSCSRLTALPAGLGALTGLRELDLRRCPALHTPPPRVVASGTRAVLAFLRDLGGGSAPCHLVKLVLLGEQRAGKSSLADSLVRGRPATRPADDRTVGIDVRRWWLGAGQGRTTRQQDDPNEELVALIYDAAGHRVYRASHGAFVRPTRSSCTSCAATSQMRRRSRRCSSGWRRCSRRRLAR
jgi:hypothetical protein